MLGGTGSTRRWRWLPALGLALLIGPLAITPSALAQPPAQIADEVDNQPTEPFDPALELLRPEDARLTRLADRLVIEVTMTTPTPATYVYPDTVPQARHAAPEMFTLWVFVFNHPGACVAADGCGPEDFSEAVRAGVYGVAGHVTAIDHSGAAFELDRDSGGRLTLRGEIIVGAPQRPDLPPEALTFPLEDPLGAEVHVAVAPHGQVDPLTIGTEIYEPTGNPGCGCWWLAFFHDPGTG